MSASPVVAFGRRTRPNATVHSMSFRAQVKNLLFRELPGWPSALSPLPILGEGKGPQRTNSVTLSLSKGGGAPIPSP